MDSSSITGTRPSYKPVHYLSHTYHLKVTESKGFCLHRGHTCSTPITERQFKLTSRLAVSALASLLTFCPCICWISKILVLWPQMCCIPFSILSAVTCGCLSPLCSRCHLLMSIPCYFNHPLYFLFQYIAPSGLWSVLKVIPNCWPNLGLVCYKLHRKHLMLVPMAIAQVHGWQWVNF